MAIPDAPPEPTHYRVLLTDFEGSDAVEIQRLLEDCGLRELGVEELSSARWSYRRRSLARKLEHCGTKIARLGESRSPGQTTRFAIGMRRTNIPFTCQS